MSFALRLAALGLVLLVGLARTDWVEIPQFSDHRKVYYRQPVNFNSDRKLYQAERDDEENDRFSQRVSFHRDSSSPDIAKLPVNRQRPTSSNKPTFVGMISSYTTDRTTASVVNEETHVFENDGGIEVETFQEDGDIAQFDQPPIDIDGDGLDEDIEAATVEPMETTTTPLSGSSRVPESSANEQMEEDDKSFLDYLPIDLLKRVHKTLRSQPPNLKGKIRFLKLFERNLVGEIESRLSAALSPVRLTRGARDHHDEHEEGIGFPSLEGALMAISFLTFAVYLVRLVMLLFRNTNNVVPPIVIGRKRRSVDDFADETARILGYLDSTMPRRRGDNVFF